jgi:hypothetical protein
MGCAPLKPWSRRPRHSLSPSACPRPHNPPQLSSTGLFAPTGVLQTEGGLTLPALAPALTGGALSATVNGRAAAPAPAAAARPGGAAVPGLPRSVGPVGGSNIVTQPAGGRTGK